MSSEPLPVDRGAAAGDRGGDLLRGLAAVLGVAAVQHDIVWHDREANFARLAPKIAGAAASEHLAAAVGLETYGTTLLRGVTGSGKTYRNFMFAQGTVTMLLLAFAGAMLVGDDHRQ